MDALHLLQTQINKAIAPPEPLPIFTAVVEYPPDCWYRLKEEAERNPEDLAQYVVENLSTEEVVTTITGLGQARQEITSTCGLRLVVLFQRDAEGALHLDDIRFMDATEFSAFQMNSGKKKNI